MDELSKKYGSDIELWLKCYELKAVANAFYICRVYNVVDGVRVMEQHVRNYKRQQAALASLMGDMVAGTVRALLLIYDYAQNVVVNRRPIEDDANFFGRGHVTLLGISVFITGMKVPVFFDGLSTCLAHSSSATVLCMQTLQMKLATTPQTAPYIAEVEELHMWSDNGRHFDNFELAHHALVEKVRFPHAGASLKLRTLNNTVEHHGKMIWTDGEFGRLKRHLGSASLDHSIDTVDDLMKECSCLGTVPFVFETAPKTRTELVGFRIHSTYALRAELVGGKYVLRNAVFSDRGVGTGLVLTTKVRTKVREDDPHPEPKPSKGEKLPDFTALREHHEKLRAAGAGDPAVPARFDAFEQVRDLALGSALSLPTGPPGKASAADIAVRVDQPVVYEPVGGGTRVGMLRGPMTAEEVESELARWPVREMRKATARKQQRIWVWLEYADELSIVMTCAPADVIVSHAISPKPALFFLNDAAKSAAVELYKSESEGISLDWLYCSVCRCWRTVSDKELYGAKIQEGVQFECSELGGESCAQFRPNEYERRYLPFARMKKTKTKK
jgi:hypothetical protein